MRTVFPTKGADMDDDAREVVDAVASILRVMSSGDLNDADLGKALFLLARVLEHPELLV